MIMPVTAITYFHQAEIPGLLNSKDGLAIVLPTPASQEQANHHDACCAMRTVAFRIIRSTHIFNKVDTVRIGPPCIASTTDENRFRRSWKIKTNSKLDIER
jgi:hypothetical protein